MQYGREAKSGMDPMVKMLKVEVRPMRSETAAQPMRPAKLPPAIACKGFSDDDYIIIIFTGIFCLPGRPLIRGHFLQNSISSINHGQIAQYFDMLRKIGKKLHIFY